MTARPGLQRQRNWEEGVTSTRIDRAAPPLEMSGQGAGSGRRDFSRREMLTYVWVGTLAAMTVGSGLAAYKFLYPRQPVNVFGGKFYLGAAVNLPPVGSDPQANVEGRFWLANTVEGLRAFYDLCTHSWGGVSIRYKWEHTRARFECPACGSKFSLEGHYIEGPASRSLDQFVVEIVTGRTVVAETTLAEDAIESPPVLSPEAEIVVDTGTTIEGLPSSVSPLLKRYQG